MFLPLRLWPPQTTKSPRRARSHAARAAAALLFLASLALAAPLRAANSGGSVTGPVADFTNPGYIGIYRHDFNAAENGDVTIDTGIVGPIIGGFSVGGNAWGNRVTVTGGTHAGEGIYGGYTQTEYAYQNIVTITGGTIHTDVFGGYSRDHDATDNTLRIFDSPDLSLANLIGGHSAAGSDDRTGNTLEIHTLNLQAASIKNFQHFRFYLPETVRAGDTVLTVTQGVNISTPSSGPSTAPTTVGVGIMGSGTPLAVNDTVTLIQAPSLTPMRA
ncbi:hypothetical protein [Nitratidesulfovibrio liaohensis]|uniref:hypothetical protein n=1 Tax=Nitratidesulfovibrio liaohensis TaxID=2604158 RepID=UPI001FB9EF49|nr:hypothetical protein [Nitratidesulfovibrio liaohensis]